MEKATSLTKSFFGGLVTRKMERFFSIMIMLVVGDWVMKRISLFGTKTDGEDPFGLAVLVLLWIVVSTVSQLFDEKTLLGKILIAVILPKIESRIIELGTQLMTSALPKQSQPSTDAKGLESRIQALDALPGSLHSILK